MNNIAFLIGCEEYEEDNIEDLVGVSNDIDSMHHALIKNCDCPPEHTYLITDQPNSICNPTGAAILKFLIEKGKEFSEKPIDNLFFYFSGHGYLSHDNKLCLVLKDSMIYPLEYGTLTQDIIISTFENFNNVQNFILILDMCQNELVGKGISINMEIDPFYLPNGFIVFYSCFKRRKSYMIPPDGLSEFGVGSIFTTCFVKSLDPENNCYNVDDISSYLDREVTAMSRKLGYEQQPYTQVQNIMLRNVTITSHRDNITLNLDNDDKEMLDSLVNSIEHITNISDFLEVGMNAETEVLNYYTEISNFIGSIYKRFILLNSRNDPPKKEPQTNLNHLLVKINDYMMYIMRYKRNINSKFNKFVSRFFKKEMKSAYLSILGDDTSEFVTTMELFRLNIKNDLMTLDIMESRYFEMLRILRIYVYAIDFVLKKPKNRGTDILMRRETDLKTHIKSYEELISIISRNRNFLIDSALHIHSIVRVCSSLVSMTRILNIEKDKSTELDSLPVDDIVEHLRILNENIRNIKLY